MKCLQHAEEFTLKFRGERVNIWLCYFLFQFVLPEEQHGGRIGLIQAYDLDIGINADLTYRLADTEDKTYFQMTTLRETNQGELTVFSVSTVKPVLSGHSKKTPKLVFKTDYLLMQVESIAECSKRAFCNTFDLH